MQLSLLESDSLTLERALRDLAQAWAGRFPVAGPVAEAERITALRFAAWAYRELTPGEYRRISAYFGAIVRRRVMRGADQSSAVARRLLVQASIEKDLREAGWRPERARAEAQRCTGVGAVSGAA